MGIMVGLAALALVSLGGGAAFADDHGGRDRGDDDRGRERGDREVLVITPNTTVYQPRAAAPRCAATDPSSATVDSVFGQFMTGGGLTVNQAALIGNALYLSANEVELLSFDQLISMTQCAGVSLDTLASILSGA